VGAWWVVSDGLNPGERVIVDGIQKVGPGMHVKPKPAPLPGN
jgi:membrane fusion protein (multidrug efflux system)